MSYTQVAAGYRRYDVHFAAAEATAKRFKGLPPKTVPGQALAAFKRAARHLGAGPRVIQLVDLLFSWTRPQDWEDGQTPIVWPRNETLAEAMGIEVRQVQNLLRQAVHLRLVSHRDSPNGHRGGTRDERGFIRWGYGIDLSPVGARYPEFLQIAEAAALEARARDELRRRLTIARKSIFQIAQTALEQSLAGADWLGEVDLARMAAGHARGVRSIEQLSAIVEQLESRRAAVHGAFTAALAEQTAMPKAAEKADISVNITSTDVQDCTDSTTTTPLQPANAGLRNGSRKRSSGYDVRILAPQSSVEADLERYGVDVAFVGKVCADLTWELEFGRRTWGDLVRIAERIAGQNEISGHAWHEACRIMGEKGAAAAVIATVHKHHAGEVRVPGAYLRGMTAKALSGELQLGRTFHGFREAPLQ